MVVRSSEFSCQRSNNYGLDKQREWQLTESSAMHCMEDSNEKETEADLDYAG